MKKIFLFIMLLLLSTLHIFSTANAYTPGTANSSGDNFINLTNPFGHLTIYVKGHKTTIKDAFGKRIETIIYNYGENTSTEGFITKLKGLQLRLDSLSKLDQYKNNISIQNLIKYIKFEITYKINELNGSNFDDFLCELTGNCGTFNCVDIYEPVCAALPISGTVGGQGYFSPKTYSNECFARKANATIFYKGECFEPSNIDNIIDFKGGSFNLIEGNNLYDSIFNITLSNMSGQQLCYNGGCHTEIPTTIKKGTYVLVTCKDNNKEYQQTFMLDKDLNPGETITYKYPSTLNDFFLKEVGSKNVMCNINNSSQHNIINITY